jgi:hypothetical protein
MVSVGKLIIIQSRTFCVVNVEAGEASDPVSQLNTTYESYGFTNLRHWLKHIAPKLCRLSHVAGKLFQSGHVIQQSVVAFL